MSGVIPSFSGASLGDLAQARAALEEAERRAQERAEAARQRAEAVDAAERADEAALQQEIADHLGNWTPVTQAEQALAEAKARHRAAEAAAATARQAAVDAREVLPALVDRAVAGGQVGPEAVAAAHTRVARADQHAAFCAIVANRYAALVPPREEALKAAIAEAHRPVLERGIDLRIEGAAMADAARSDVPSLMLATDGAHRIFVRGTWLMQLAVAKGVLCPSAAGISSYWPTREHVERRTWRRPAPGAAA